MFVRTFFRIPCKLMLVGLSHALQHNVSTIMMEGCTEALKWTFHALHTVESHSTKIWNKCSQKWNCAASFPNPTFTYLWAIYIFPPSVHYFAEAKVDWSWEYINRSQIHECKNWEGGHAVSFLGIHKSNLVCNVKPKILWTCMEFRQVIIRKQLFLLVNCKHLRAFVIKPYLSAANWKQSCFSKKYSFYSALHTQ